MLPQRPGPRPRVTRCAPHEQLDQFAADSLTASLVQRVQTLAGVNLGPSRRAPAGTVGFHLPDVDPRGREGDFMFGREFAHVHPEPDASLHVLLPEPIRSEAVAAGWAEPHPLAGTPTVPTGIVLVYAPREASELEVVISLIESSWNNARSPQCLVA